MASKPFQTYSDRPQLNRFTFLVSVLEHLITAVVEKSQLFLHGRGFWSSQFHEDPKILAKGRSPPASSTLIQAPHIPRQMACGHRNARQRSRWPQRAQMPACYKTDVKMSTSSGDDPFIASQHVGTISSFEKSPPSRRQRREDELKAIRTTWAMNTLTTYLHKESPNVTNNIIEFTMGFRKPFLCKWFCSKIGANLSRNLDKPLTSYDSSTAS